MRRVHELVTISGDCLVVPLHNIHSLLYQPEDQKLTIIYWNKEIGQASCFVTAEDFEGIRSAYSVFCLDYKSKD